MAPHIGAWDVTIGYAPTPHKGGTYVLLGKLGDPLSFSILEFSDAPFEVKTQTQEMLYVTEDLSHVQPAFASLANIYGLSEFTCKTFLESTGIHTPCTSELMRAVPMGGGLNAASGVHTVVDKEKIAILLERLPILHGAKNALDARIQKRCRAMLVDVMRYGNTERDRTRRYNGYFAACKAHTPSDVAYVKECRAKYGLLDVQDREIEWVGMRECLRGRGVSFDEAMFSPIARQQE